MNHSLDDIREAHAPLTAGMDQRTFITSGASICASEASNKSIISGTNSKVFRHIRDPGVTLIMWQRSLAQGVRDLVERIRRREFELTTMFNPFCDDDSRALIQKITNATDTECHALTADLRRLAYYFADACSVRKVRIRLETIRDDGCRKFHLDNVGTRLVTTYAGTGTQWVSPSFGRAAQELQQGYTGPINAVGTENVAMFKGKKSRSTDLIFHRSPPMENGNLPRLVAVIDTKHKE